MSSLTTSREVISTRVSFRPVDTRKSDNSFGSLPSAAGSNACMPEDGGCRHLFGHDEAPGEGRSNLNDIGIGIELRPETIQYAHNPAEQDEIVRDLYRRTELEAY